MIFRLENWSVAVNDPYTPPEHAGLYGEVYDNPKFENGMHIRTSYPVKSEGRIVTTKGGSQYLLGAANPDYVEYLKGIGREIDEENPVKVING